MNANGLDSSLLEPRSVVSPKVNWTRAYLRFLLSRDENISLKIAPLALLGILPIDVLSNIIPVIGELDDIGFTILLAVIIVRTIHRVQRYR